LEANLTAEIARLQSAAGETLARLKAVKSTTAQVQRTGLEDPALEEIAERVQDATVPSLEIADAQRQSLEARAQALAARNSANAQVQEAVRAFATELSRISSQVAADEAALDKLEQRARQEREQKAKAEEQTRRERAKREEQEEATQRQAAMTASDERRAPAAAEERRPARLEGRREAARVRMQAAIDLHSDTNFFTGFSTNISDGGIFVATVAHVPHGSEVELKFTLPSGEEIDTRGIVRWTREVNDKTPEIFPGLGIQFVDLDERAHQAIARFVASREPLFYPD
jgi:uncharacterized protein (TIGR02266 family)